MRSLHTPTTIAPATRAILDSDVAHTPGCADDEHALARACKRQAGVIAKSLKRGQPCQWKRRRLAWIHACGYLSQHIRSDHGKVRARAGPSLSGDPRVHPVADRIARYAWPQFRDIPGDIESRHGRKL